MAVRRVTADEAFTLLVEQPQQQNVRVRDLAQQLAVHSARSTRTEAGLNWVATDHNGTGEVSINSNTQQVSRRRHLPFGEPRGQAPPSWPSERGFVGGTTDAGTGLTHLGAREYDPTLGRFISVDPIMDLTNAQQMNGYTYSNNNPVTFSDPTGLFSWEGDSSPTFDTGTCRNKKCDKPKVPPAANEPPDAYTQMRLNGPTLGTRLDNRALDALRKRGYTGSALFTRREALAFAAQSAEAAAIVCHAASDAGGTSPSACEYDVWNWAGVVTGLKAVAGFAYQLTPIPDAVDCAGGDGGACAWLAGGFIPGMRFVRAADNVADAANGARKAGNACKPSSFVPGTKVLMADGTHKPIEDVKVGDQVLATDPVGGETAAKKVVGTITTQGQKDLVKLTVDTDGATGDKTGVVAATAAHPFWAPGERRWLDAEELHVGSSLRTMQGGRVAIRTTKAHVRYQRVHNLTVADIHTYYVLAGQVPVLVHNSNGVCGSADPFSFKRTEALSGNASKRNVDSLTASMKENGWQGDPISVAKIGDDLYILDGHHRVAAAKRAGVDVPYTILSEADIRSRYLGGFDDIAAAWAEVGPDRLVNRHGRPGYR